MIMNREGHKIDNIQTWPAWRRQLHGKAFLKRLEKTEPCLRLTEKHVEQIDAAISVTIHWKSPEDRRLSEIRRAAGKLGKLLRGYIDKGRQRGVPPKHCLPGCDDADSLMHAVEKVACAGVTKARKRGRPSDEVTDFLLRRFWEIYSEAKGEGTLGTKNFAYFLDELTTAMPKHLLGQRKNGSAGKWLRRRAKDLAARVNRGTR